MGLKKAGRAHSSGAEGEPGQAHMQEPWIIGDGLGEAPAGGERALGGWGGGLGWGRR